MPIMKITNHRRFRLGILLIVIASALLLTDRILHHTQLTKEPAFLPPAGEFIEGEPEYTFAVMGDSQPYIATFKEIVTRVQSGPSRFILHTGDVAWRNGGKHFDWLIHKLREVTGDMPIYWVPGNHDVNNSKRGLQRTLHYNRAFGQGQYWFFYGKDLFIGLDNSSWHFREKSLDWLENILTHLRPMSRACFVYMHIPPRDPRTDSEYSMDTKEFRPLMELLGQFKTSAVFAGHIHSYLEDEINGVPVYISGGAGAHQVDPIVPFHYLLCRVKKDGSYTIERKDIPDITGTEYLEYYITSKYPVYLVMVVSIAGIFAGLWMIAGAIRRNKDLAPAEKTDTPEK